jgi:hypothetical protein
VGWIDVGEDDDTWWAVVKTAVYFQVAQNVGNFLVN